MDINIFEYIWVDGFQPPQLRSKILVTNNLLPPEWTFDGSSTNQSAPETSDLILVPVKQYMSPFSSTKLVLCDVHVQPDIPIKTSFRSKLKEICEKYENEEITVAVEQEYTMFRDGWVYGWTRNAYPELKSYYCGGWNRKCNWQRNRRKASRCMSACRNTNLWDERRNNALTVGISNRTGRPSNRSR